MHFANRVTWTKRLSMTTFSNSHIESKRSAGWLDGPTFDLSLVMAPLIVGLISVAVVSAQPNLFIPILLADLWLLGYHHVISTFTRFDDAEARREHRTLLLVTPVVVVTSVAAISYGIGFWVISSIYLYWQAWHYARQSWGVHRVYQRKSETGLPDSWRTTAGFYAVLVWGLAVRSAQSPDLFLGVEIRTVPVPSVVATAIGIVALGFMGLHAFDVGKAWLRGGISNVHATYLATHQIIFFVGYVAVANINFGWLGINIWHNAQYIAFVWYFNHRRYSSNTEASHTVARLSRRRNPTLYLTACLLICWAAYYLLNSTIATVVAPIVVFQTINFTHYVWDSFLWKVRKKPMQQTLGLS